MALYYYCYEYFYLTVTTVKLNNRLRFNLSVGVFTAFLLSSGSVIAFVHVSTSNVPTRKSDNLDETLSHFNGIPVNLNRTHVHSMFYLIISFFTLIFIAVMSCNNIHWNRQCRCFFKRDIELLIKSLNHICQLSWSLIEVMDLKMSYQNINLIS